MLKTRVLWVSLMVVTLFGCAPAPTIVIPSDFQTRDLFILPVEGMGDEAVQNLVLSAAQARSNDYRELVRLVEAGNDNQTLRLAINVNEYREVSNNEMVLELTTASATVSATLLDPATGSLISSVTRDGTAAQIGSEPPYAGALRNAVVSAVDAVLQDFANGL